MEFAIDKIVLNFNLLVGTDKNNRGSCWQTGAKGKCNNNRNGFWILDFGGCHTGGMAPK